MKGSGPDHFLIENFLKIASSPVRDQLSGIRGKNVRPAGFLEKAERGKSVQLGAKISVLQD